MTRQRPNRNRASGRGQGFRFFSRKQNDFYLNQRERRHSGKDYRGLAAFGMPMSQAESERIEAQERRQKQLESLRQRETMTYGGARSGAAMKSERTHVGERGSRVATKKTEESRPRVKASTKASVKKERRPAKAAQKRGFHRLSGLFKARGHASKTKASESAGIEREKKETVSASSLAADLARQAALQVGETPGSFDSDEAERLRIAEEAFLPPRHVHMGLLVLVSIMIAFGLVMLFSASMTDALYDQNSPTYYIFRQIVFTVLGILMIFLICRINPRHWNRLPIALIVYAVTTLLLILVLIPGIGIMVNHQRRWLPLVIVPGTSFQPSEIAKLATIYCGAVYFSHLRKLRSAGGLQARSPRRQILKDFAYDFVVPLAAVGLWCFLISQQSHMSSVLIILLSLFVVFLAGGIRARSWAIMISIALAFFIGIGMLFAAFRPQIESYMADNPRLAHLLLRMDVFSGNVTEDSDENYQTRQALIGIGSGGLTGVGLGQGRQKFNWLPEIHNDYVFSNICEELGFIGGSSIILMFVLFFILGLSVTFRMQSMYMQILAAGFSSLITIQAFLSIGVNLKVFPPTGISLPLFSYGGTSNLFFQIGIAFLLSASKYGTKRERLLPAAPSAVAARRGAALKAGRASSGTS